MMHVFLNTEISARELDGNLALGILAASRGHTAHIFDQRYLPLFSKYCFPRKHGVFHTKSLHSDRGMHRIHATLKERSFALTVHDQEAGILSETYDLFAQSRFSSFNRSLVDRVFCWGDWDSGSLTHVFPELSARLRVTGSPRADLWRSEFQSLSQSSTAANRQRPFVLISSNFVSNWHYRHWEVFPGASRGWSPQFRAAEEHNFFQSLSDSFALQGHYMALFRAFGEELPEVDFIVRPHPIENPDGWKQLTDEFENVKVVFDGALIDWVRHSVAVVQTGCTSAVEASVAGVPVITYLPIPLTTSLMDFAIQFGEPAQSAEEVLLLVREALNQQMNLSERTRSASKKLSSRINYSETCLAVSQILDEWELLGVGEPDGVRPPWIWSLVEIVSRFFLWYRTKIVQRNSRIYSLEKFSPLERNVVRERAELIGEVLGARGNWHLSFLGKRSLRILPKRSSMLKSGLRRAPEALQD